MTVHDRADGARSPDPRVVRVAAFFDALASIDDLPALPEIYTDDASFEDPFNRVEGRRAIFRVFAHMYTQVDEPRFRVLETLAQGDAAFLVWVFSFRRKGKRQAIDVVGTTHLRFAPDGRVAYHRDYWDPAKGIYEKLPWIGGLFRAVRRAGGSSDAT